MTNMIAIIHRPLCHVLYLFILLGVSSVLSAENNCADQQGLPLYFWDARPQFGFSNFGDDLSKVIIERMIGREVPIAVTPYSGHQKLLGIGSILSYAQDNDLIWGTGVNGKTAPECYQFTTLDVRSVRGPLTRQFLLEKGISCPEIYGDPTLLLPLCFPEFQVTVSPSQEYVVIPHYSDEYLFENNPHLVSVKEPWSAVVQKNS